MNVFDHARMNTLMSHVTPILDNMRTAKYSLICHMQLSGRDLTNESEADAGADSST